MSSKYLRINLEDMLESIGEDRTKAILTEFSCEINRDVENFIKYKAIEFSKQSIAKTQLIYYVENIEGCVVKKLVGYFSLTQKSIYVSKKALSNKLSGKLKRFARFDHDKGCYVLPVILIGQIGKNYTDNGNKYISGDDLLEFAFQSITLVQRYIGGRFVYLESEDKEKLVEFYARNGFSQFGKRKLDGDETDLYGEYLLQWICYMGNK